VTITPHDNRTPLAWPHNQPHPNDDKHHRDPGWPPVERPPPPVPGGQPDPTRGSGHQHLVAVDSTHSAGRGRHVRAAGRLTVAALGTF